MMIMDIEAQTLLIQKIQQVYNPILKEPLSETESLEILINLEGFAKTLLKMKKEVEQNEK